MKDLFILTFTKTVQATLVANSREEVLEAARKEAEEGMEHWFTDDAAAPWEVEVSGSGRQLARRLGQPLDLSKNDGGVVDGHIVSEYDLRQLVKEGKVTLDG